MDTFEAIYARRAAKQYDPQHVMPEEDLRKLLEAAIQSPTSFNIQHWRFVVVRDKELRKQIRAVGHDQAQMTDASILIVMTADKLAWKKDPQRYRRNARPEVVKMLVDWMGPFHEGRYRLQRDEAMRSIGMASQTIMLAAKVMGRDSCPMTGFDAEQVAKLIRRPADHAVGNIIAVGKAANPPWPEPGRLPLEEVVIHDRFDAQ
jgi:nitroreductase